MNLILKKSTFLLFTIFLSTICRLSSQNNTDIDCGTTTSKESLEFYNSIKSKIKKQEKSFMSKSTSAKEADDIKTEYISIKAHIVRSSQGNDGLNVNDLNHAIENLNTIFENTYIQFLIDADINYIDDDTFSHFHKSDENELTKNNFTEGSLNIYFLNDIENDSHVSICGYANISANTNIILMKNSCVTNNSSLAHEIGHILSLIHTHGPNDNMTTELVNGSNCDTDGDGICDTPADPKLDSDNMDYFCNYIGTTTDTNGDKYQPDTNNIMSYSFKGCRIDFSQQQQARMYVYLQYIKAQFNGKIITDSKELSNLNKVIIYPNPVSDGTLYISSELIVGSIHYEISNLYGQVLSKGLLSSKQINVSNLSAGTYILSINDGNSWAIKKFIK